jgi:hypothetical protein
MKPPVKLKRVMMKNSELESLINEKLNSASFSDYGPNGCRLKGVKRCRKYHRRDGKPGAAG